MHTKGCDDFNQLIRKHLRIFLFRKDENDIRRLRFSLLIIIIIVDSMTSVFNTDTSLPYSHDLFASLIIKKRIKAIWIETDIKKAIDIGWQPYLVVSPTGRSDPTDGTTRRPMWHEFICMCAVHGCMWVRILSGRPHLDKRTIRVLNQSPWLKSLTAWQRCLAGNANAFLRHKSPHVPTFNLEGQETVFVRPLTIDQPGMRNSVCVAGTPPV
ncbi:hypothetical protein CSKR_103578 [Clonorchis sinensis]|uniref:Uncharacterized protein n=1 Tax=Clonorchis sinensis TaxID=79923 RepID=A0A3R7CDU6_CLOSI|nr:hypothetical protein CSKR_103578 [Clonorchis sinensis]